MVLLPKQGIDENAPSWRQRVSDPVSAINTFVFVSTKKLVSTLVVVVTDTRALLLSRSADREKERCTDTFGSLSLDSH